MNDTDPPAPPLNIFFVLDGLGLEKKALILAASLHHQFRDRPEVRRIAYVPESWLQQISPISRIILMRCGAEIRTLPPPGRLWKREYPHGNKIIACADRRDGEIGLFLDTDTICVGPLDLLTTLRHDEVGLVPEGIPSWGKNGDRWERAYAHFGLPVPEERIRLMRRRRREFLPYFNAGVVAFHERPTLHGQTFGELWRTTASDFDHNCAVGNKRPWLDQITLPLTLHRFNLKYLLLPEEYNFSISKRAPTNEGETAPSIIHYHKTIYLEKWPWWPIAFGWLSEHVAKAERAAVATLMADSSFGSPSDLENLLAGKPQC